jgi:alpha/beta superfamily hydrolase
MIPDHTRLLCFLLMTDRLVCFNHGKESGPWGTKITQLAKVAQARGFDVISPDYRHTMDPRERVRHLLQEIRPQAAHLVLAGSSMGGYVAANACEALRPQALFLMAPALYFPGWEELPARIPALSSVVHGWQDDVVPVERGIRFAQAHRASLHVLDSGHSLNDQLEPLSQLFDQLLGRVLASG